MTVPAGYVNLVDLPDNPGTSQLIRCSPKAGIWINADVVGATATEHAQFGDLGPGGGGQAGISFGAVDETPVDYVATFRGTITSGASFSDGHSHVVADGVTGTDAGTGSGLPEIRIPAFVPPGWELNKSGTFDSPTDARAFFLALEGDTLESAVGTFTLPSDGSPVSVSGLAFEPAVVIVFGASTGDAGGVFNVGALDGDGNQWSAAMGASYIEIGLGNRRGHQMKDAALLLAPSLANSFGGNATPWEATGAITADGFDVTQGTPPGEDVVYGYLALYDSNGEFTVGFDEMSVGASGLAAAPEAVLVATVWEADESDHDLGAISLGYLAATVATGPGTNGDASLAASVFTRNEGGSSPGRWRSNDSDHSLVETDTSGTVITTQDLTLTSDGFTTSPSDGSELYGWVTLRGSFQAGCETRAFVPQIYRLVLP